MKRLILSSELYFGDYTPKHTLVVPEDLDIISSMLDKEIDNLDKTADFTLGYDMDSEYTYLYFTSINSVSGIDFYPRNNEDYEFIALSGQFAAWIHQVSFSLKLHSDDLLDSQYLKSKVLHMVDLHKYIVKGATNLYARLNLPTIYKNMTAIPRFLKSLNVSIHRDFSDIHNLKIKCNITGNDNKLPTILVGGQKYIEANVLYPRTSILFVPTTSTSGFGWIQAPDSCQVEVDINYPIDFDFVRSELYNIVETGNFHISGYKK